MATLMMLLPILGTVAGMLCPAAVDEAHAIMTETDGEAIQNKLC